MSSVLVINSILSVKRSFHIFGSKKLLCTFLAHFYNVYFFSIYTYFAVNFPIYKNLEILMKEYNIWEDGWQVEFQSGQGIW